ncbi:hypothetical protein CathTA2_1058 [Caldalkalibacillus thermarum TA2.A1]|uniref:Uncharacterized protein n=1 Tax=Caldalkalibacillus thermarum (strain TA2.A1) TaxID=986075 RepID=F5L5J5_CALTT|nr:hypothetical protein [Caldalkalibacillus thermarum]EGL83393.1 hypothetical protein CathTA2_1058 [Caldalkalibacillus thermarum TA2.A1]QZT35531.1 hypothetical protein HUR95_03930 [Caldalkalibacillus thermarum TA2.A1]
MDKKGKRQKLRTEEEEPTIAPSMEMDELEEDASFEDIATGNYTRVTKLDVDRLRD